jgi:hypothetical protein
MLTTFFVKISAILKILAKVFVTLFAAIGLLSGSTGIVKQMPPEKDFMKGDTSFVSQAAPASHWTVGFAKAVTTPADALSNASSYYLGGYNINTHPTEIFDNLYVRAVYMDDNSGRGGVLFAVIDAVGLSNKDVLDIRALVADFAAQKNIKSVNVSTTHLHSGIDTLGLWGIPDELKSGINKTYMVYLKNLVAQTMVNAYNNRKNGDLYWGDILPDHDVFTDSRAPYVYDKTITRIRFSPAGTENDRSDDLYMCCMNCHSEMMAASNSTISADFSAYMGRYIASHTGGTIKPDGTVQGGADFIFFNGAVGALITGHDLGTMLDIVAGNFKFFDKPAGSSLTYLEQFRNDLATVDGVTGAKVVACLNSITPADLDANGNISVAKETELRKAYTMSFGETIGRYICDIDNKTEHKISPIINIRFNPITLPIENTLLTLAAKLDVVDENVYDAGKNNLDTVVTSEVGYLELGNSLRILLAPGELAPEIAMGGFLPAAESVNNYDMNVKTGFEIIDPNSSAGAVPQISKNLVFGLMNDEIGYIIPDNDYYVNRYLPYLVSDKDRFGKGHYEEGVSTSQFAARILLNGWQSIYNDTH